MSYNNLIISSNLVCTWIWSSDHVTCCLFLIGRTSFNSRRGGGAITGPRPRWVCPPGPAPFLLLHLLLIHTPPGPPVKLTHTHSRNHTYTWWLGCVGLSVPCVSGCLGTAWCLSLTSPGSRGGRCSVLWTRPLLTRLLLAPPPLLPYLYRYITTGNTVYTL